MLTEYLRQERGFALGSATLTCVVKTLATACRCSAALAVELLEVLCRAIALSHRGSLT